MQLQLGRHLEESQLEQYSMGNLPEERAEPFEEHLLACEVCQDRLLEMDAYVNAVRSVSPRLRAEMKTEEKKENFRAEQGRRREWMAILTKVRIPVLAGCAA